MNRVETFEKLLASGQDSALLRYSLGTAYQAEGRLDAAAQHLAEAVAQDPEYSAAWKALGKVLAEAGRRDEAKQAFRKGIAAAGGRGDIQAAKEMNVFLKRLEKATPSS